MLPLPENVASTPPGPVPDALLAAVRGLLPLEASVLDPRPRRRRNAARWVLPARQAAALVDALASGHGVLVSNGRRVFTDILQHGDGLRSLSARATLVQLEGRGRVVVRLGVRLERAPLTRRLPGLALVVLEDEAGAAAGAAVRALRSLGGRRCSAGVDAVAAALASASPGAGRLAPAVRLVEALAGENNPSHVRRTDARGAQENLMQEEAPVNFMKTVATVTRAAAAAALLATAGHAAAQEGPPPGPPRQPPPEAIQACSGRAASDACQVSLGGRSESGTCFAFDGTTLACRPAHGPGGHRGPPPEAVEACKGVAEGEACAVTLGGNTLDGTCAKGPDGSGTLACRPSRMPPPPDRR
ncbi:MAG: hypothetical protein QM704_08430 [Anaeromyxobacteraceae bacterium]